MPVKFLSEEWTKELKEGLNASEAFRKGVALDGCQAPADHHRSRRRSALLDQDRRRHLDMGSGDIDSPDASITQDYETAVALARSEINPVSAFMSGKLKIGGNMMLIMSLQGAFSELPKVMQEMDVHY